MEGILTIMWILGIIWSILSIILFFKVWGMCNNVRTLTKHFCEQDVQVNQKPQNQDDNPNAIKVGDKVIVIENGEEVVVKYIYPDGDVACNSSDGGVRRVYNRNKVKKVSE